MVVVKSLLLTYFVEMRTLERCSLLAILSLLLCFPRSWALASMTNRNDVAVIGCGVLGTSLCKQLLESPDFSSRTITGVTKTSNRHESISKQVGENKRFVLTTADEIQGQKFRDVVFCAPPSGFDDYPAAVEDAVANVWEKTSDGVFVFTSSGGM